MAAIIIVLMIALAVFVLHRLGLLKDVPLTGDSFWIWFVYVLLVLGVIGLLSKIWSIVVVVAGLNPNLLISPSQNLLIDTVSTLMLAAALYGIWHWQKWGAYLILLRLAFTIVVQIFIYHSLSWQLAEGYTGSDNLYADVSGAISWLVAFFFTWKHFKSTSLK